MLHYTYLDINDIKIWLEDEFNLEDTCYKEALNLAEMPFVEGHLALMSDCHASGHGVPIGTVLATKDVILKDVISNDIGCGVAFKETNIPAKLMEVENDNGTLTQMLAGQLMRNIPTGKQHCHPEDNRENHELLNVIEKYQTEISSEGIYGINPDEMYKAIEQSYEVVGTLGEGNHFIELQVNENGELCIMIHSGSRSVGAIVNKYFKEKAKELNDQWYVNTISDNINFPFLPVESKVGKQYIKWMNFALEIARLNRKKMMDIVTDELEKIINKYTDYEVDDEYCQLNLNVHHNYVDIENVNGENYWVHRKGAVRARKSDLVPIPGAMGSPSYIVKGKQNPESYHSCSHGAGRTHSRTDAFEEFNTQEMMEDLNEQGIVLAAPNTPDVVDEYKEAYKDINTVIENQSDLAEPIMKLEPLMVLKG